MSMPRIARAASRASSGVRASLIPPAFPRPPTWTCAFTATGAIPRAAASASSGVAATLPGGIGMPARSRSAFAWYSCSFISLGAHARLLKALNAHSWASRMRSRALLDHVHCRLGAYVITPALLFYVGREAARMAHELLESPGDVLAARRRQVRGQLVLVKDERFAAGPDEHVHREVHVLDQVLTDLGRLRDVAVKGDRPPALDE